MGRIAWLCPLAVLVFLLGPRSFVRAEQPANGPLDAKALAAKIDEHVAKRWAEAKVKPAPLADDAEFLRRAYLDVAGKIPPVTEVRRFLNDKSADKRQRLVEKLLDSPGYVGHFGNIWRAAIIPETNSSFEDRILIPGFEGWLRKQLQDNVGYDEMVRELLTLPIGNRNRDAMQEFQDLYVQLGNATPLGFYQVNDFKPENLGARTARLFLGVRLECAQCHDHPFARWKRDQFWGYAAFFAGIQRQGRGDRFSPARELLDRRELAIPGKEQVVQAVFLDGAEPAFKFKTSSRVALADWMTQPDNRFFARAAVNRMWAHFFGIGLVDPVDDLGGEVPPSHPELLDELARQFAANKFDLKYLVRAITSSKAYQLTSEGVESDQEDPQLFARMAVRGLSPEQIFDSLSQAIGYQDPTPLNRRAFSPNSVRGEILTKFGNQSEKRTEFQTSIPQALALMNGRLINDATSLERSTTLAALADAPFLDSAGRIEALYLATLSRKPRADELERLVKYVNNGGALEDPKKALADVLWVLLNSSEFIFNH